MFPRLNVHRAILVRRNDTEWAERPCRARALIGWRDERVADERNDRPKRVREAPWGRFQGEPKMIRSKLLLSTAVLLVSVGFASAQGMREGTGGGAAGDAKSHMSQGAGAAGGGHAMPSRSEGAQR